MLKIKNQIHRIVFLFVTALFVSHVAAGETPQISHQDLLSAMESTPDQILVLDVRSAQEYAQGHIKQAINVSHDGVENKLTQLSQYKDKTVVVYCRSGRRAGIAEHILAENGFKNVVHLTGDMNGWLKAKLPVVKPKH